MNYQEDNKNIIPATTYNGSSQAPRKRPSWPTTTTRHKKENEARDDVDEHSVPFRHTAASSLSLARKPVGSQNEKERRRLSQVTSTKTNGLSSRGDSRSRRSNHPIRRQGMAPLNQLHLELIHLEREKSLTRLKELQSQLESLRKEKSFERSKFLMRSGNIQVQIDGLQEDRIFLLKKRERLQQKEVDMKKKCLQLQKT